MEKKKKKVEDQVRGDAAERKKKCSRLKEGVHD